MKNNKQINGNGVALKYTDSVLCCKWYDNQSVLLLASNIEGMNKFSTVRRRMKGSLSKIIITCPALVELCNEVIDIISYRIDRRSDCRFYILVSFFLMDAAPVNSHIVYEKLNGNLNLLDFKIVVANFLIEKYRNRQRNFVRPELPN